MKDIVQSSALTLYPRQLMIPAMVPAVTAP